ncbi:MAG: hypothetical protein GWP19_00535 [Planctomycetia bacterium]|nr:hypothetical protein [Planctomycetia bacterium]
MAKHGFDESIAHADNISFDQGTTILDTDGQIWIGATEGSPTPSLLTSSDASIIITNKANGIDIDVGASFSGSFVTDSGTATPATRIINMLGGTNISSVGATNNVTFNLNSALTGLTLVEVDNLRLDGNTISSTNVDGDINITPNGTGTIVQSKVDINSGTIDGTAIGVAAQSTGSFTTVTDTSRTQNAVAVYGTGGALSETALLTDNQVILGSTGNPPTLSTIGASIVFPNTGSFAGILSGADTNVQLALDTIDDVYSTASWTPVLEFGGASVGITYTTQTATYRTYKDMVFINGRITLSNKGTSVGTAIITGLPFTCAGDTQVNLGSASFLDLSAGYSWFSLLAANTTTGLTIGESGDNIAYAQVQETAFANTTDIEFTGFYFK